MNRPQPWANLSVPAQDGTSMAVDTHLPTSQTWPVTAVVHRTPYGRSQHLAEGRGWASRGYAYVVGDVRGRYDSDGVWAPYRNERADGADLIDWIARQPWSDGRVVAYGGSYSGFTAWAMAVARPERVAAVVSLGPSMSLARTKFSRSGILRLAEHAAWWAERADSRTSRDGFAALYFAENPGAILHLPVSELGDRLGAELPHWNDLIAAGPEYLDPEAITDAELASLTMPSLHVGGWFDLLVDESLHHWATVGSATPGVRKSLVIGPWLHDLAFSTTTTVGDRDFGDTSTRAIGDELTTWIGQALNDEAATTAQLFVMGDNRWSVSEDWPPVTQPALWIASGTELLEQRHAAADGQAAALVSGLRSLRHDVSNPFPSYPPGADRSPLDDRDDVIRFTGEPLPRPISVLGNPRITGASVHESDCVDWIVRLTELTADGRVFEIAVGEVVLETAARHFRVELGATAITVPAGSRLRLEFTGSDFPRLARNLGLGGNRRYLSATDREIVQSLGWSAAEPIVLELPLVSEPSW